MIKRLAVLLLRMTGAPDLPTKNYAEQLFTNAGRGTRNLVDYYDEMSHGQIDLGPSKVFDWVDYGHTNQDLMDVWTKARDEKLKEGLAAGLGKKEAEDQANVYANGVRRAKIKEWGRDAAAVNQYDLTGFDVVVYVFNQPVDYFGSPDGVVLNWDPSNGNTAFTIDLTGVAHEVGHGLGLNHSRRVGSTAEYGDLWDIMSAYTVYRDTSGTNTPPGSKYFTFGPGLNAVNMDLVGWLDPTRVFTATGSAFFKLRPLHRRDLSGWLAAELQVHGQTYSIEYRAKEAWDAAIPAHCVLVHRRGTHPGDGRPCSEIFVAQPALVTGPRADLREGESFEDGDKLNISSEYVSITVQSIDARNHEATVSVVVRQRRRIDQVGLVLGGVDVDGGGHLWTPGRGIVRIPPRSPVLRAIEHLAEYATLETVAAGRDAVAIEHLALGRLIAARDALSAMIEARKAPAVPGPVQHPSTHQAP